MCGSITYYNMSGSYTDRIMAQEDFIKRIQDAVDCGETITYKITSPDKNFKKAVQKIIHEEYDIYDATDAFSEAAYERMFEEQRKNGSYEEKMSFSFDELPF